MPVDKFSKNELLRLAFQDDLTSLYNRRYLHHYLTNEVNWSKTETPPLSLMMIDIDFFKEINDTHGHLTGDAALTHLARIIKETVGKKGIAIRYAGDEFSILMPRTDKPGAYKLGEKLRQKIKSSSLAIKGGKTISFSISGGVATFPLDARSAEELIDDADKELYAAKRSGRNRVSGGEAIDKELMAERELKRMKTIPCPVVIGREEVFKSLQQLLGSVTGNKNLFILLEGETGLGKTRILKELTLMADKQLLPSFLRCNETDRPNPYKSILNHIRQLFEKKALKAEDIAEKLPQNHQTALKRILPGLFTASNPTTAKKDTGENRKILFEALMQLLTVISKKKGVYLFFDEFQNIDAGSLEIINYLVESGQGQIAFGGTLRTAYLDDMESYNPQLHKLVQKIPAGENYHHLTLTPLDQFATSRVISAVLPKRDVNLDFDEKVYKISHGNPLFIEELLKNFVLKEALKKGKDWEFKETLTKEWKTDLDSLIQENLSLLDKQTAQLVNESSVVGTELDLSVIKNVTVKNEGETLEILDKAKRARIIEEIDPLLQPDQFRFVNQRIQEVTYDTIDEGTRQTLHAKVGEVEEEMYADNLDEVAAALAFHFAKAGNKTKAGAYEQRVLKLAQNIFRSDEAQTYHKQDQDIVLSKINEATTPLDAEAMKLMREVLRSLCATVKNVKLYPEGSKLITQAFSDLVGSFNKILDQAEAFTLSESKNALKVNNAAVTASSHGSAVNEVIALWKDHYIMSVTFTRGLSEEELEPLLRHLDLSAGTDYSRPGYWNKFLQEKNITHIGIAQRAFIAKGKGAGTATHQAKIEITPEVTKQVRDVLRYLCASIENVKLYPIESQITHQAIESLNKSLGKVFEQVKIFTLGLADDALLLNGTHLHPRTFGASVQTLSNLIKKYDMKSISLLQDIDINELGQLVRLLGNIPADEKIKAEDWPTRLDEANITNALVGQLAYSLDDFKRIAKSNPRTKSSATATTPEKVQEATAQGAETPRGKVDIRQLANALLNGPPEKLIGRQLIDLIERLLAEQEPKLVEQLLNRYLDSFKSTKPDLRRQAGQFYGQLLTKLPEALRYPLAQQANPVLKKNYNTEQDKKAWPTLINPLPHHLKLLWDQKDYTLFAEVCLALRTRQDLPAEVSAKYKEIMRNLLKDEGANELANALAQSDLDKAHDLAKTVTCLGEAAVPLVSELIGNTPDEARRTALANIIKAIGPEGHTKFIEFLGTITDTEKRRYLIGILDIVAPAGSEAIFAESIRSADIGTRDTALAALKRSDKTVALNVLLPALKDKKRSLITLVLDTLVELGYTEAGPDVVELLKGTTDQKLQIECCEALGKLGNESAIPALIEIITTKKKFLGLMGGYPDEVRGQATRALGNFKTDEAKKVLEKALKDASPMVRSAARLGLKG